jgi:multidrug efflux pump subunit AcrA (membrane-fusion protein)
MNASVKGISTLVRARRRRRGVAAAIGQLAAASVITWYVEKRTPDSAASSAAPQGIPVTAGQAEARNVPMEDEGLGTVQAFNTVSVKSRVDGQITKVLFEEGQEVEAGDPLFQIDPRPFQAALQQAQANKQKDEIPLSSIWRAIRSSPLRDFLLGSSSISRRALSVNCRGRSAQTRHRSRPLSLISTIPSSARLSRDARGAGWLMSET